MGAPEGEKREQEIENLCEKMIENFYNLVKGIDTQIQKARSPKWDKPTPRHTIIKVKYVKDKERILKAAREKQLSYLQGSSHKTGSWFLNRNFASQ